MIHKESFVFKLRDGADIYCESRGQGPALILVYGIACQMNHWGYQIAELSKFFQVISYDLRGHFKSSAGKNENLTVRGLSKDLKELCDHLGLPEAHFAGHSFGVPILIDFASHYPHRCKSLTLINGFVTNPLNEILGINIPHTLFPLLKELNASDPQAFRTLWELSVENPLATVIAGLTGGFNLKATELKDIEIYFRGVAQMDTLVFFSLFESLLNFNGVDLLPKITAPSLVIGGEKDQITPIKFQKEIHQGLARSELVIVEYGSHCCQLDFPTYVNLLMKEHILKNHINLLA